MRYRCILLGVIAALGCSATEVPPERVSDRAIRIRVDSLNAEGERLRAWRAAALLAEPPDFTGRITSISATGGLARGSRWSWIRRQRARHASAAGTSASC